MTLEHWPDAIEALLGGCSTLRTLTLLRETVSTQDAARAAGAPIGTVVVAGRQTQGRGRLGRTWCDTASDGVAVTCVVPRAAPERLAMLSAVAACDALWQCGAARVRVKWPNDVMLDDKKLGGVLVEQGDECAWIGIGINVLQRTFPPSVAGRAISLAQAGMNIDRLQVVCALVTAVDSCLQQHTAAILRKYLALEQMTGRHASFATPDGPVQGTVITVDPEHGLVLATPEGMRFLAASTTSVVPTAP